LGGETREHFTGEEVTEEGLTVFIAGTVRVKMTEDYLGRKLTEIRDKKLAATAGDDAPLIVETEKKTDIVSVAEMHRSVLGTVDEATG
jgi:hypothetical protein